jgi:hypothetical protein
MHDAQLFADAATHAQCLPTVERVMKEHGCEVTVTVRRPRQWTTFHREVTCPHGITYFTYPTEAQFAEWQQMGRGPA